MSVTYRKTAAMLSRQTLLLVFWRDGWDEIWY